MLNKFLFVLIIILMFVLGFLSIRQYIQYRDEQLVIQAEAERVKILQEEKARLDQDCVLKLESYNILSEAEKQKTQAPECGLEIIE